MCNALSSERIHRVGLVSQLALEKESGDMNAFLVFLQV